MYEEIVFLKKSKGGAQMSENKIKMTFIQKLENFWYHYKWHTILGAFLLVIVTVCTVQCVGRSEPDAMIMYAGRLKNMIIPQKDNREYTLEDDVMSEDYNGDGKKKVEIFQLIIPISNIDGVFDYDDKVAQTNNSERQRMYTEVATGTSVVYLLHPFLYEEIKDMGVLRPLSEVTDRVPDYAVDEYGIPVSELIAYSRTNLRYFPEDCILCIRHERTRESNAINPDDHEFYQNNVKYFNDIIKY